MPSPTTTAQQRAREYEAIYILRPDLDAEGAARVNTRISDVISRESGVLTRVESWGRRKLAYPVRKFRRGIYVYLRFLGGGGLVSELERNLRMQKDAVLKFQTIKLTDMVELKDVAVDPEEIKFSAVEPMTDEERDESREKLLGLVEIDHGSREDRRERAIEDEVFDTKGDEGDEADEDGEEK